MTAQFEPTTVCQRGAAVDINDNAKIKEMKVEVIVDEVEDPWAVVEPPKTGKDWKDMTTGEKIQTIVVILVKLTILLGMLYLFVCSLSFLSDAFRLVGGKAAGEAMSNNEILNNPVSNMMMGILATVLLQSSSTTTSIVVAMVGSKLITVRMAIFIVMGANIGTSVTNTIVSIGQIANRNEFRRAFAAATVHDMFNWLAVISLLPLEWISGAFLPNDCGFLCQITEKLTNNLAADPNQSTKKELLKAITKPFTKLIMQLDKKVIQLYAMNKAVGNETLVKHKCSRTAILPEAYLDPSTNDTCLIRYVEMTVTEPCEFMFEHIANQWSDAAVGACLLIIALAILCICLICIVKLLHSLLQGRIARGLKVFINADFPGVFRYLTGYVAILFGAGMTVLVQSSSVFTSAMTPLVGVGVLHLDRMYPLTLGSNIGTTFTAILAALATDRDTFHKTLQVALCHLFFNIFGIAIWYPIPFMRTVPINLAKKLGNTTAKFRWFAILYLVAMFFLFPGIVFGLSVAGTIVLIGVGVPLLVILILVVAINIVQSKRPTWLPVKLRNWNFLPIWIHSLEPYDKLFSKICIICQCCMREPQLEDIDDKGPDTSMTTLDSIVDASKL